MLTRRLLPLGIVVVGLATILASCSERAAGAPSGPPDRDAPDGGETMGPLLPDPTDCAAVQRALFDGRPSDPLRELGATSARVASTGCFVAVSSCDRDRLEDIVVVEAGACDLLATPPEGGAWRRLAADGERWFAVDSFPDGSMLVLRETRAGVVGASPDPYELYRVSIDGQTELVTSLSRDYAITWTSFELSPDGRTLAFGAVWLTSDTLDTYRLFFVDVASGEVVDTTAGLSTPFGPVWAPDGRSIYLRDGGTLSMPDGNVYRMRPDGTGVEKLTSFVPHHAALGGPVDVLSPDGSQLAFYLAQPNDSGWADESVWLLDTTTGAQRLLGDGAGMLQLLSFSPSGRRVAWVAFVAGDTRPELFVYDLETETVGTPSAAHDAVTRSIFGWDARDRVLTATIEEPSDPPRTALAWLDSETGEVTPLR